MFPSPAGLRRSGHQQRFAKAAYLQRYYALKPPVTNYVGLFLVVLPRGHGALHQGPVEHAERGHRGDQLSGLPVGLATRVPAAPARPKENP